jgi:energy-coupling factor transport system ATP-binding protein
VVSTTVRAELALPLQLRGEPAATQARAVEEAALALAIPQLLDRTTDSLSGGELQRVALATALVARPALVLLDEPTSQLDPVAGDELISLLRRLNEQWGTAVVLCEHRVERCVGAVERVVALDAGRLAFDGAPQDYLEWAVEADPALATPAATMFSLAGLRPLPVGVKEARRTLSARGIGTNRGGTNPGPLDHETHGREVPGPSEPRRRRRSGRSSPQPQPALELRDLWVELDPGDGPREVVRGIELNVNPGERVALMGRNGAGKSTLLRTCAGLVPVAGGSVSAPDGCSLLTQNPGDFLVRERVGDELPGNTGLRALRDVGLEWALERDPRDLSGGERQRLALAIVMAGGGEGGPTGLVCFDEPTRGMDRARKDDLARRIIELADAGSGVIVATHDVEFAAGFCERVVLLADGNVIADGPRGEVLSGGWYFATEVARVLGSPGAVSPVEGAELIRSRRGAPA